MRPLARLDYASPAPRRDRLRPLMPALVGLGALGVLGLLVASLMPSGARINRDVDACKANLTSVGQSLLIYASEHGGAFPASLDDLHPAYLPDVRILVCRASGYSPARDATPADLTAGGHVSFVYVGNGLNSAAARGTVLALELPAPDLHDGVIHVLFADGRVERVADYSPVLAQFAAGVRPVMIPPAPTTGRAK